MRAPAWFLDGLREMKETGRSGVVFTVPAEGYLTYFSEHLEGRIGQEEFLALRRRAVVMFLPRRLARACLPEVEDGRTLVHLDSQGKVLASEEVDLDKALNRPLFRRLCASAREVDAPVSALPYGVE